MAGETKGALDTVKLVDLLGQRCEMRKSLKKDKRYPLYLSTCIGPIHFNSKKAQDFLLEHAEFISPENIPDIPDTEIIIDDALIPEKIEPQAAENPEKPEKKPASDDDGWF